jgi:glycosyltransferase involved in cell wall biosynthesis
MPEDIALSVAIITMNEEANLPACLESVRFAGDIVVVDSGSTDRTVPIAEQFGCRVYVEDWKGDGPQKNSAIEKCLNDWVLVLDADERLSPEGKDKILEVLQSGSADAYSFRRKSIFHGRWIRSSGWWPDRVTRLFRKSRGRYIGINHGVWSTEGHVEKTDACIEHYSFTDYADMLKRLNNYSNLGAAELNGRNVRSSYLKAVSHGFFMFFRCFFLKRGFMDGMDGLVISLTKAGGSFFKYAKLLEMQRAKDK